MPHVVDLDDEKQPFLDDDFEDESDIRETHHSQLGSKSQLNNLHHDHINIGGFSNGELNGGLIISSSSNGSISKGGSVGGSGGTKAELAAKAARSLHVMRLASALFYAVASFLITVVNKVVLTSYK
jgi:hypothetical protein